MVQTTNMTQQMTQTTSRKQPSLLSDDELVSILNNHLNIAYDGTNIYRWYIMKKWENYGREVAIDWTSMGLKFELEQLLAVETDVRKINKYKRTHKKTHDRHFIEHILDLWLQSNYNPNFDINVPPLVDLCELSMTKEYY